MIHNSEQRAEIVNPISSRIRDRDLTAQLGALKVIAALRQAGLNPDSTRNLAVQMVDEARNSLVQISEAERAERINK